MSKKHFGTFRDTGVLVANRKEHCNILHFATTADFFEDCIKEEQYEAEKLDILRDAVRAKATYNMQSKGMVVDHTDSDDGIESSLSSPRALSPSPAPQDLAPVYENGESTATSTSNGGTVPE